MVVEQEISWAVLHLKNRMCPQKHSSVFHFLKQNLPNFKMVKWKEEEIWFDLNFYFNFNY